MHYGVDLGNMEALWKRALHELDGSCSARSSDDEKKSEHSGTVILKRKRGRLPDEYSRPIAAAVRPFLTDKHPDTILEIGPGWGNYTFMLAELCRELMRGHLGRAAVSSGRCRTAASVQFGYSLRKVGGCCTAAEIFGGVCIQLFLPHAGSEGMSGKTPPCCRISCHWYDQRT